MQRVSAAAAAAHITQGQLRAVDYVGSYLEQINKHNPTIQALSNWSQSATADDRFNALLLQQAQAIDERQHAGATGVLAGIPIAVKDVIDVANMPTAYGAHEVFCTYPSVDALCVSRLRQAGAIIVGKAATAEFAYAAPPPTKNPHQLAHTPGGSSSGSAAGVAAGMFPLALSTQTGGSIIRPAAFCGVYGFKPSYGLIDSAGMQGFAPSFDTIGWHGQSLDDMAILLQVLAPAFSPSTRTAIARKSAASIDASANTKAAPEAASEADTAANGLRLGFCQTPYWSQASPDNQQFLSALAQQLGAPLIELPVDVEQISADHRLLMAVEMSRSLRQHYDQHGQHLSAPLKQLIEKGQQYSVAQQQQAQQRLIKNRQTIHHFFSEVDLLLAPAAPGTAPLGLHQTGSSIFNCMWSALHVPCLSLPLGQGSNGLPLGLQLIGHWGGDYSLLSFAQRLVTQLEVKQS